MLCFLTVRKLKPGSFEAFHEGWMPKPGEMDPEGADRWTGIYTLRNLSDPDEVISFGLYDGDASDLEQMRGDERYTQARDNQRARITPHIESIGADGVYEVVEVVKPEQIRELLGQA
jgi:hypothetical protein